MTGALHAKTALVTGASSGIGRAIALAFARAGAEVIANGRRAQELAALAEQCRAEGIRLRSVAGDLDDPDFVRHLAATAGAVDLFAHNAGTLSYAPLLELTDAECEAMFRTNVLAALQLSRAVATRMVARGRGHIIMMTSLAAREVYRFGVVYAATKHALTAIAAGLRIELQAHGIKVTEIRTGMVATGMRDGISHPDVLAALKSRKYDPLTPDEVAMVALSAATAPENSCLDLIEMRPRGSAS